MHHHALCISAPAESRLGRRPAVPLIQIYHRPTAGEASSSLGMLQCIVAADGDSISANGDSISVEQLSAAARDSISALIQRLPDGLRWAGAPFGLIILPTVVCMLYRETAARPAVTGGPCYTRCYRDQHLHVPRTALRHAFLSAVHSARAQPAGGIPSAGAQSESAEIQCEMVDLPVVGVAHAGARLAVQIYFDAPAATT